MGGMKDHFLGDTLAHYPATPGFKKPGTSQAAAKAVAGTRLPARKQALLDAIAAAPNGLTADEAAHQVGESVLYARPRVTELYADKRLIDTGHVRKNESGLMATVWKVPGK